MGHVNLADILEEAALEARQLISNQSRRSEPYRNRYDPPLKNHFQP